VHDIYIYTFINISHQSYKEKKREGKRGQVTTWSVS